MADNGGGWSAGRLSFRPRPATGIGGPGDRPLELGNARDGVLYVPDTADRSAPLMVFLHGATGTGRGHLRAVLGAADRYGVPLLAPDSRGTSWDGLFGSFGPDVAFLDRALDWVADHADVDLTRLALGGVSDGASYALSLGLSNGDVFGVIVAFSPGGARPGPFVGRPRIFVSHGRADPVLPIDACSRRLVPLLRETGYEVAYEEFDGGHTVPPAVADRAFAWWLGSDGRPGGDGAGGAILGP